MNLTIETDDDQTPVVTHTPSISRRSGIPVAALIPLIVIASGIAYFVGRGTTTPPAATTELAKPVEEKDAESVSTERGRITLSPDAERTAGIRTTTAMVQPVAQTLSAPGIVEVSPDRGASVTAPVAGRVIALFRQPGDRVNVGQLLARLDSPEVAQAHANVREAEARIADAQAALQIAESVIEQARTRYGSAQSALLRQKELAAAGQIAQPVLQSAQNALNDARAAQQEADAGLALARSVAARAQRLFDAQIAPRAELEQAQTAVRQAEIQADRAKGQIAVSQAALAREQRVYGSGILNRQAVQGAQAEVAAAQGNIRQAQKQAQSARTALAGAISAKSAADANLQAIEGSGHLDGAGRIALYSPISGTIAERRVSIGQAINDAREMFTIQNLSVVSVVGNVPEADAARVRPGARVTVTVAAFPQKRFTGTVRSIGNAVDEKTRALPVRCIVPNTDGALKPQMFAQVVFETGTRRSALVVPDAAVDEDGEERFVYVAVEGGYEKRPVTIGSMTNGQIMVLSGLKAGERVVTDGMFVLKSESKKDELKEED